MIAEEALWYRLAVALGIGLVVGLERGWKSRAEPSGQRLAGFRTFTLAGLCGGILAALSEPDRHALLAVGMLVLGALVVGGYVVSARQHRDFGMTTELALLATFALGATAVLGAPFEATAAAVVMALLLGFKTEFHGAIGKLERVELLATLQLVAIAAVLVPLLPDRYMGPWDAINPRTIGMLVLLIAGMSYVGYFAVRMLGARIGLLLTAVFGGLSSSTAVTVAYARRARGDMSNRWLLAAGIVIAQATVAPRLLVEIAAVNRSLLPALLPTLAAMALVPVVAAAAALLRKHEAAAAAEVELGNPLQLTTALTFGLLLMTLFVAAAALSQSLGDAGAYAVAALAALFDVDAVSLAMAEAAARGTMAASTATRAIVIAMLVNTGVKAGIAALLGGASMLRSASAVLGAAMLVGAATAFFTLS